MDAHKLQLKIFVAPSFARTFEPEAIIPVFHRWIQSRVLPELVIDVANYGHVPEGPGVVLIGDASDYFMDCGGDRLGLLCSRKRAPAKPPDRLIDLARRTLHAAQLLEQDPALAGKIRFATGELLFRINDRLAAPSRDVTFPLIKPELEAVARRIFAGPFELAPSGGPKDLFSVRMTSPESAPLATLLDRVGGPLPRE